MPNTWLVFQGPNLPPPLKCYVIYGILRECTPRSVTTVITFDSMHDKLWHFKYHMRTTFSSNFFWIYFGNSLGYAFCYSFVNVSGKFQTNLFRNFFDNSCCIFLGFSSVLFFWISFLCYSIFLRQFFRRFSRLPLWKKQFPTIMHMKIIEVKLRNACNSFFWNTIDKFHKKIHKIFLCKKKSLVILLSSYTVEH